MIAAKPNKNSSGPDGMPFTLMKLFPRSFVSFLSTFFNHLIANAYFPKIWRHASITPIPKPGKDSSVLSN